MTELSDRVSRLEGAYEHLATKADIAEVKGEIAKVENRLAQSLNRNLAATIGAIVAVAALLKYLPG